MKRYLLNPNPVSPTTGEPLLPQFFTGKRGLVTVMPCAGGAPDGDDSGTGSGEGGTGSGGAGAGSTDSAGGTGGAGGTPKDSTEGEPEESVPLTKFKQMEEQLRQADKKRAEHEAKLKEIEDKDKTELERATGQVAELKQENEALKKALQDARLENAFLAANDVTWHDPGDALALAQRKGFLDESVDAEGKVDDKKIRAGLKKFAEAHKHLIKQDGGTGGEGSGTGKSERQQTPPPLGGKNNSNGAGKVDDQKLKDRYRALRN